MSETNNTPRPTSSDAGHSTSDQQYLARLTFNPKLRKSFLNIFVTKPRIVLLLIVSLTIAGVYAFTQLPRESNPEVKIAMASILTTYPGASPADIEELVTKKIENGISNVKNVKTIESSSANSVSMIVVEFEAKADLEESIRSLRDAVSGLKGKLPDDANDPSVREISLDDTPIWTAAMTSPVDGKTLRDMGEELQDELEKIPGVREVSISGGDETRFEVAYDPLKLTQFGISADQANQAIAMTNVAVPSGSFDGREFRYPVRSDGRIWTAEDIGNIPVTHAENGGVIAVKDLARVQETVIKKTVLSRFGTPGDQPSRDTVTIQIIKKTGGSIIKTIDEAQRRIDAFVKTQPQGTVVHVVSDQSELIKTDFSHLTRDFLLTVILVFGILFLVVGLKEAFVAGLAVPLVFFATFVIMLISGISLNFLSMFSLILSLGLLVDDAIVVVSATKQYLNTGKFTPEEAVLLVLNDFKVVLTTTTLTTVWAFLPLLMSTGIMGEFIKSIPITASTTLLASLFIALLVNHPLAAVLERIRFTAGFFWTTIIALLAIGLASGVTGTMIGFIVAGICAAGVLMLGLWFAKRGRAVLAQNGALVEREWNDDELIKAKLRAQGAKEHGSFASKLMHGIVNFHAILPWYERVLRSILKTGKRRMTTLAVIGALFVSAIALPVFGIVKMEFFPNSDFEQLSVFVEAPPGTKLDVTNAIVERVEARLRIRPEIESYSTLVGVRSSQGVISVSGSTPSHTATITLKLKPEEERTQPSYELAATLRQELSDIKDAKVTVESPESGPPAGSDIEMQLSGDDLAELEATAHALRPLLAGISGVVSTDISLKQAPADYTFRLDPSRMEFYGVNAAMVGGSLRTAISGTEVTTILEDGKEKSVVATFMPDRIPTLEDVQNLQILNTKRQPIFLKDVATVELQPGVESISRIDKKRTVVLSGSVDANTRPAEALTAFQSKLASDGHIPDDVSIKYGGQNEQNTESVTSIIRAMAVAAMLIIITLIVQFNSLRQSFIVLVTIPLALIGVMFGLAITGIRLSFPGLIGIVALFGIVVKNAIILVDKMNLNRRSGIPFIESVVDACTSRLEAIFITSICTIVGILPITFSDATWRALGSAVIAGLMLSSFFTLFVVPTLYISMYRKQVKKEQELASR
ncbi:MAG: efflux RND transporter permease subunit [Candidatus Uhrbacteria bacterium]|nr:efflux RND transporter permease subunit [Candidatus Uhrbacteria bacterium]